MRELQCLLFVLALGPAPGLAAPGSADAVEEAPVRVEERVAEFAPPREVELGSPAPWPGLDRDGMRAAEPVPLLERSPDWTPRRVPRSTREVIEYDLRTRLERRMPATEDVPEAGLLRTRPGDGEYGDAALDVDLRRAMSGYALVLDPTIGVRPRHVKLKMTFRTVDGGTTTRGCSGTLVGSRHVVTAAHCVYSFQPTSDDVDVEPLALEVEIAPGWNGVYGPAGNAFTTSILAWTGWTDDEDSEDDVALLTLDRPVGALVGWRGLGASSNWDHYDSGLWESWTYPGSDFDDEIDLGGQQMYYQSGSYDYDDDPMYGADRPGYKGTSGGGSVKDNAVWAVRTLLIKYPIDDVDTYDTAIGHAKLADILQRMDVESTSGSDLWALDVRTTPTEEIAGNELEDFDFLVHNSGSGDHTGGVSYTVYVSSDPTINTYDTYVTSGSVSGVIPSKGSVRVDVPQVVIPPQLDSGTYYLGVVLTVQDSNLGNNATSPQDAQEITVTCAAQGIPQPVNPDDDHPCVNTDITLAWGSIPGVGVSYEVVYGKQPWALNWNQLTSSTQHTFYGLEEGTEYFWRVRAYTACGGPGDWSEIFSFTTRGQLSDVSLLDPVSNTRCTSSFVTVNWDPKPTADQYRVRFQKGSGPDAVVTVHQTAGTSYTFGGLDPNESYYWSVKARDACGYWGDYGGRSKFSTAATGPLATAPLEPAPDAITGPDLSLKLENQPAGASYEYQVETSGGVPVETLTADWIAEVTDLTEGEYRWRGRVLTCTTTGDVEGPWTDWQSFSVDATAPTFASPPTAITPPVDTWTANPLVTVQWSEATDPAGVQEYWLSFDQSATTVPDGTTTSATAGAWEATLPDGANWFHVVAVDAVGNVTAAQHLGPILVDTTAPGAPEISANLEPLQPTNVDAITVSWPATADAGSGVAGYSFAWATNPDHVLDDTIDVTATSATLSPAPEGSQWFFVRAVDALGHAGEVVSARYFVDRSPPFFNRFELPTPGPYVTGQIVDVEYVVHDNFGPSTVRTFHFYSVDGGSFWYDAVCEPGSGAQCYGSSMGGSTGGPPNQGDARGPYYWRAPWVPEGSEVLYRIVAVDQAGNVDEVTYGESFTIWTATDAETVPSIDRVTLEGNAPNPFNPRTTIRFALPAPSDVRLAIFDLRGRLVRTLVDRPMDGPSWHDVVWDGTSDTGRSVASGVYVYRLVTDEVTRSRRMSLLK